MKHALLSTALLILTLTAFSQTVTWNGASGIDNDWNTDTNWDTAAIPGPTNDVVIPDGFLVDIDTPGADVFSLDLQGSSILNAGTNINVVSTFNIAADATLNFNTASITSAIINNLGTINVTGTTARNLGAGTTLNNDNLINFTGTSDIFLNTNSVLNNSASGVIDFQTHLSGISSANPAPHILNNSGLIKSNPPVATDQVTINVQVNNNNGTIQVENGVFNLAANTNHNNLTDGMYITFPGTTFNISNASNLAGTLSGAINGTLNWLGFISVPAAATFDFGGTEIINVFSTINGGGTLTNKNILNITTSPINIQGSTILLNQDIIRITGNDDLNIQTDSTLNNDVNGTIDFQGNTGNIQSQGASPNTFLNSGLIQTSFTGGGSDSVTITADLTNNGGTISVNNGTMNFGSTNITLNGGIYNIASDGILDWDSDLAISGSLTGDIQGALNWNSKVNIFGTASLDFTGTQIINWNVGNIDGGGVLTNNNIMDISNFNVFIFGATTLNNNSIININNDDDLLISTGGILNNQMLGTINLLGDGSVIGITSSAPRTLNNFGNIIVNLPNATDNATITSEFNNNNGNIEIQKGILNLDNNVKDAQNLLDGVYNIFIDGTFDWESDLTISGELTGNVDGPINWKSTLWVNDPNTATFFFTGLKKIFWPTGSLNGGGTLINQSDIDITSTGNVNINGGSTLNNGGNLTFTTFGDLGVDTNGTLNNLVDGNIEMQVPDGNIIPLGGVQQIFNNLGTFKVDSGGINSVGIDTNNSGLIDIASGELEIGDTTTFNNEIPGIIKGVGSFDLPIAANFNQDGSIIPGISPGTLTIIGDYSSTPTAKLEIEIDGPLQGTEFDYMPITNTTSANVVFDGIVNVTMGYEADINDEFIISTLTGTGIISTCNLQTPVMATFDGNIYEFSVLCRNDNEVVLTVTNKTLSVDSYEFSERSILLFPNPTSDEITIKNMSNVQLKNASIVDLRGSIVENLDLENMGEQKTYSLRNLSAGVYFIKINSDINSIVKRIIKL